MIDNSKVKNWYQASYLDNGINAQRLYPNEELLRFMGRNFFSLSENERKRNLASLPTLFKRKSYR